MSNYEKPEVSEVALTWSAAEEPNSDSSYNHCFCETPLGRAFIEWKSWKDYPGYTLQICDQWIGCFDSLDEAKTALAEFVKGVGERCLIAVFRTSPLRPVSGDTNDAGLSADLHQAALALIKRMADRETDKGGCLDITTWLIEADRIAALACPPGRQCN